MVMSFYDFCDAIEADGEEAHAVLAVCNGNKSEAMNLFPLYPRAFWTTFRREFIPVLASSRLDMRKQVLDHLVERFPRDAFEESMQELGEEDRKYLGMIVFPAFLHFDKGAFQREEFAQTLQLGKTVLLPVFQEWSKDLRSMEKVAKDTLEWESARERLKLLLSQTLPNLADANPVFHGIEEDVVNLRIRFSNAKAQTALHIAASFGDIDLVNYLLACSARLDAQDNRGNTALHAGVDHPSIVEALLSAAEQAHKLKQYAEQVNYEGKTALHLCSNAVSAQLLLRASPYLMYFEDQGKCTPLHLTIDNPDVVEVLLEAIQDSEDLEQYVQQVDNEGQTALHLCRNAESARLLLDACPTLVFAKDKSDRTPLHLTTVSPGVVEVLLKAIEDPEQLDYYVQQVELEGQTALHHCRHAESARLLLRVCPTLMFAKDDSGRTPLQYTFHTPGVVKVLLEAIKDPEQLDHYVQQVDTWTGQTALHLCRNAHSARLLLRACPSVLFTKDNLGHTALHLTRDIPGVIKVLLETIQDPEQLERYVQQVDDEGRTALHRCHHAESARLLLRASPSLVFTKDDSGCTPLHLTTAIPGVVEVLLEAIKDPEQLEQYVQQVGKSGNTALHLCRNAHSARLLLRVCPSLVSAKDDSGYTPLHYTIHIPGMVKVLLEAIKNPEQLEQYLQQVDDEGRTVLHRCRHAESARLLLDVCPSLMFAECNYGETALRSAIDFPGVVKVILEAIEDPEQLEQYVRQVNRSGGTALHWCRHAESARLLLRVCPNLVSATNISGYTPLQYTIHIPGMVKVLLDAIQDPEQLEQYVQQVNNKRGQNALVSCRHAESARLLLRACPSLLFAKDKDKCTPLHLTTDYPDVVEVLLEATQATEQLELYVQQVDRKGRIALHLCRHAASARLLLRACPSVLFAKDNSGHTPLHYTIHIPGVAKVLLDAIQDPEKLEQYVRQVNDKGQTALHHCRIAGSARMLLRMCPSLVFAKDDSGCTPLHATICTPGVVEVLLEAIKDPAQLEQYVQQVDEEGKTALHVCNNLESARLLLEVSPNLASIKCRAGCTPLHYHVMRGSEDVCQFLIEDCGVDVNAVNARGQTPLHLACMVRRFKLATLLLKHSAHMLARDIHQRTMLHYALLEEREDGVIVDKYLGTLFLRHLHKKTPFNLDLFLAQSKPVLSELVMARDAWGRTALHYFADFKWSGLDWVDKMMMAGVDGAAEDEQGDTVMHVAARCNFDMALHLVKHWGLSIHAKNRDEVTALDLVHDDQAKTVLKRASGLAGIVTLPFAARPRAPQSHWKRLPRELFRELCSFLV